MNTNKEYFAFISYKSEDVEWATWLQQELEHYHLPASFNGRTDIPQELRPVFRDIDELSAGNLPEQIKQALDKSQNLIVICSPQAAKSRWVNQEVETFIALDRTDRIFPFIVEGKLPSEFFPPALRDLPQDEERLGGDVSNKGRDAAFVKVVAGMLGVGFDSLWNRYEKEKAEEERKIREQRDKLLIAQSRFLAEKANALSNKYDYRKASLLALEALPINLSNPERPFTEEAGSALRKATENVNPIIEGRNCFFCDNGENIIYTNDLVIKVCNSTTGLIVQSWIGNDEGTNKIVLSPNQKIIASISKDSNVNIWDLAKKECIRSISFVDKHLYKPQFSPNNHCIAYLLENSMIERYDLVIWDIIKDKQWHVSFLESFYFSISHDSKRIIVFSPDSVTVWDMESGKLITNYGEKDCIRGFYSPFSSYLAIERRNHTISILNSETMQTICTLSGHSMSISSIAFCRDNHHIVSTSTDKTLKVWNIQKGDCQRTYSFNDIIFNASFSPDGKRILFEKESEFVDAIEGVCKNEIRLLDINPTNEPLILEGLTESALYADFSPCGLLAVSSYFNGFIRIWDTKSGEKIKDVPVSGNNFGTACFSHTGDSIILASTDETIKIWYFGEKEQFTILKGHKDHVTSAFFDLNDERIISTSVDSTIRIWNKTNGECLQVLYNDDYYVDIAAISPNGKIIASNAYQDGQYYVLIWDIEKGSIIKVLSGHEGDITSLAFNSKGNYLVSGSGINDYSVRIWSIESGACIKVLNGHNDIVNSVAFSHDDSRIISASWDCTIRIWEDDRVETIFGHTNGVNSAFFSRDDKRIISASEDHTVKIWNYQPLQDLIDITRKRFESSPLTKIERETYYLD